MASERLWFPRRELQDKGFSEPAIRYFERLANHLGIESDVTTITNNVTVIQADIAELEADVSTLEAEMAQVELRGPGLGQINALIDQAISETITTGPTWIPLVTGAQPAEFVTDDMGQLILVSYTP